MQMFKLWASKVKLAQIDMTLMLLQIIIAFQPGLVPADGINDFSDTDIDDSHITQIYGNSSGSACSDLDVNLDCI